MSDITQPPAAPPPAVKKLKRKRPPSRTQRWQTAASDAANAIGKMRDAMSEVEEALRELRAVQEEYEEWKENIEEKFSGTPVYEKLDEVCNIGIEDISDALSSAIDDAENAISEAEGVDLPRGFGRD